VSDIISIIDTLRAIHNSILYFAITTLISNIKSLLPSFIALLAAIATTSVSIYTIRTNLAITNRTLTHATAREIGKIALEFKLRQLNEFYSPLLLLALQNHRLYLKLKEGKSDPDNWHLLNNIADVLNDLRDKQIAEQILDIDAEMQKIIITKGGLICGTETPASFSQFLGHYEVLKAGWRIGDRPTIAKEETEYFPIEFLDDLKKDHDSLKLEIDGMINKSYKDILSE
jgi:hypothetical protein